MYDEAAIKANLTPKQLEVFEVFRDFNNYAPLPNAIIIEKTSVTTRQEAYKIKKALQEKGLIGDTSKPPASLIKEGEGDA